jgi:hypothetical protein
MRYRWFESISLQRGVMYEPALTLFAMTSTGSLNYRSRRADDRDHRNIGAGMDDIAFADILRWGRFPFWAKDASIGPRYCSNAMSEIVTYNLPINS